MAELDPSTNFLNRISDTQEILTRCKEKLRVIWEQELDGMAQPRVKLQLSMIQEQLKDVEEMMDDAIIEDK